MKTIKYLFLVCILFMFGKLGAQTLTIASNGSADVCNDTVLVYVVNAQPGYFYTWNTKSNNCIGSGAVTPFGVGDTIQVTQTGVYNCVGFGPSGVPETSNDLNVRILPAINNLQTLPSPYPFSTVACLSSVTLCIPLPLYENFATLIGWYKDGVQILGADSSTLNATVDGYYHYSIKSFCVKSFSDSVRLITQQPVPAIATSQLSPVCSGATINANLTNAVAGASYNWEVSLAGAPYVAIGTGNSVSYQVPSTNAIDLRAVMTYPCTLPSNLISFQVEDILPVISPAGNVALCSGSTLNLTATATVPASYQWFLNGATIIGATTINHIATSVGIYSLSASAGCGSVISDSVSVFADPLTQPVISSTGATTVCAGTAVNLTAVTGPGYTYQWKKYGNLIPGATGSSYQATTAGIYRALITSGNGCLKSSNQITVNILPLPLASISTPDPTTFCLGDSAVLSANTGLGYNYQWRKGQNPVPGATFPVFTALSSGAYRVKVTGLNGCTKNSNIITINVPCRSGNYIESTSETAVNIYPNPSNGPFHVEIEGENVEQVHFVAYDISGKETPVTIERLNENSFDIHFQYPGLYFLSIRSGVFYKSMKVLKTM